MVTASQTAASYDRMQLDKMAIADIILCERLARDSRAWAEMEACYHPDSSVEVSWFKGTGAEFVASTRKNVRDSGVNINFHVMSYPVVTVNGDRAVAETPCSLRNFAKTDGVDTSFEGFVRLLWRARRDDGKWLVAGLRAIYIRDMLHACNPSRVPVLDQTELDGYRRSYRYTCYNLTRLGLTPGDDLPGEDRPETVVALRAGEEAWLNGA